MAEFIEERKLERKRPEFIRSVWNKVKNGHLPQHGFDLVASVYNKSNAVNDARLAHSFRRILAGNCVDSDISILSQHLSAFEVFDVFMAAFQNKNVCCMNSDLWQQIGSFLNFEIFIIFMLCNRGTSKGLNRLFPSKFNQLFLTIVQERNNVQNFEISMNSINVKNGEVNNFMVQIPLKRLIQILSHKYGVKQSLILNEIDISNKYEYNNNIKNTLNAIHVDTYYKYTPLISNEYKIDLRSLIHSKLKVARYPQSGFLSNIKNVCRFDEIEIFIDRGKISHFNQLQFVWRFNMASSTKSIIYNVLNKNNDDCSSLLMAVGFLTKLESIHIRFDRTCCSPNNALDGIMDLDQTQIQQFQNGNKIKSIKLEYLDVSMSDLLRLLSIFNKIEEIYLIDVDLSMDHQTEEKYKRHSIDIKKLVIYGTITTAVALFIGNLRFPQIERVRFDLFFGATMKTNLEIQNVANILFDKFEETNILITTPTPLQ